MCEQPLASIVQQKYISTALTLLSSSVMVISEDVRCAFYPDGIYVSPN